MNVSKNQKIGYLLNSNLNIFYFLKFNTFWKNNIQNKYNIHTNAVISVLLGRLRPIPGSTKMYTVVLTLLGHDTSIIKLNFNVVCSLMKREFTETEGRLVINKRFATVPCTRDVSNLDHKCVL